MRIRKAVFPVAGLGTRFLPATKASAKEILPVVDKPLVQYAVKEAIAAGAEEMVFITSHTKNSIMDHFDRDYELEADTGAIQVRIYYPSATAFAVLKDGVEIPYTEWDK